MRRIPTAELARRTGRSRSSIKRYKSGMVAPHPRDRARLIQAVAAFARRMLGSAARGLDDLTACRAYLDPAE
ncbi:MAG: hypothetical protein ACRDM0_00395 [Thermoleophilaceae bacterium]